MVTTVYAELRVAYLAGKAVFGPIRKAKTPRGWTRSRRRMALYASGEAAGLSRR